MTPYYRLGLTARPRPPKVNWLAFLAVVIGLTVVAVCGGVR